MKDFALDLDYYSLLSLHRALLEAKFHTQPDDAEVAGSPLVAGVYRQVRDLLLESGKGDTWREWFRLCNRPDRRVQAMTLLRRDPRWERADPEEKRRLAENYLAPFLFDEAELLAFLAEADRI